MLEIYYLAILLCCAFAIPSYASELKDNGPTKKLVARVQTQSVEDLIKFPTKLCYQISNLEQKDFGDILIDFSNPNEKIKHQRELACQGHLGKAIELARICSEKKNFDQAVRWYIFAFQFHWLRTGEKEGEIVKELAKLTNAKNSLKDMPNFLEMHKPDKKQSISQLITAYSKKKIEIYLKNDERNQKLQFFQLAQQNIFTDPEQLILQAATYYNQKKYEQAAECFRKANTPTALFNLGAMYDEGRVGRKNGLPDYETAAVYYTKSDTSNARNDLARLYYDKKIQPLEKNISPLGKAWQLYKSANSAHSLQNQLLMCEIDTEDLKTFLKVDDLTPTIEDLCKDLEEAIIDFDQAKKEEYKGIIAYYRGNYDQAMIHFSQALVMGCPKADSYIAITNYQVKLHELALMESEEEDDEAGSEEEITQPVMVDEKLSSLPTNSSESVSTLSIEEAILESSPSPIQVQAEEDDEAVLPTVSSESGSSHLIKEVVSELSSSPIQIQDDKSEVVKSQKSKPQKNVLTQKEKYLRNIAKINRKLMISGKKIEDNTLKAAQAQKPLTINFLNSTVEKEFKDTHFSGKMNELTYDIEDNPFKGVGKVEVLKGRNYKGVKGTIMSRRLNQEDRLVYKVTGPHEIYVLSCKGHYDD